MSTPGEIIQAKVRAGLLRAAARTGNGQQMTCVVRRNKKEFFPGEAIPNNPYLAAEVLSEGVGFDYQEHICLKIMEKVQDEKDNLVGKAKVKLLIDPTVFVPLKSDFFAYGLTRDQVTNSTQFFSVYDIDFADFAGVNLLTSVILND